MTNLEKELDTAFWRVENCLSEHSMFIAEGRIKCVARKEQEDTHKLLTHIEHTLRQYKTKMELKKLKENK